MSRRAIDTDLLRFIGPPAKVTANDARSCFGVEQILKRRLRTARPRCYLRPNSNVTEDDGWSAIAFAAYEDAAHANFDHPEVAIVPLLLAAGANPNLGCYPALLAAIAQEGHNWTVIELLLRSGADPDSVGEDGKNILHRAVRHTIDPEFIVRCGLAVSNVNHSDVSGESAIESLLDELWDPSDIDDAAKLLAFVALDADLFQVKGRLPDWLDPTGPVVRVRNTSQLEEKLEQLRLLAAETRKSFGDRTSR
jgi:hypothetical protein